MSETSLHSESPEDKIEQVPTKEEIFAVVGVDIEKCSIVKEKKNEKGIYFIEFTVGGKEGEIVGYEYRRRGEFDGGHTAGGYSSSGTSIHEAIYNKDGDFVKFPEHIAEYNHESGEWIKV